jgi:hypothetical protein
MKKLLGVLMMLLAFLGAQLVLPPTKNAEDDDDKKVKKIKKYKKSDKKSIKKAKKNEY